MSARLWRNWYAPPVGKVWLHYVGREPCRSARGYATKEDAERAAEQDAAALGQSICYTGAHRQRPRAHDEICETCNGYGWHPADGGSYPCPDCNVWRADKKAETI